MKSKKLQKLLKKNKSNAGFTLTELLVGLFMSIFVIGALGFGLMQVLRTTQTEGSKVTARNENSRALDFISDEVRRARTVDTDTNGSGKSFDSSETVVLVLNIPEISSTGKIVYYLKSKLTSDIENWEGPQVLYRWGPPLNADGNYTNGDWQEEALIDGIDDKEIATSELVSSCLNRSGTPTPSTPKGFYACIFGDNTAQLYLTGETKTASGVANDTDSHLSDSKVVARARTRANNATDINTSIYWNVEGIGSEFGCKNGTPPWDMRTDFGNDESNRNNTTKWLQTKYEKRRPQPIEVDSSSPLTITSSAFGRTDCINSDRGNPDKDGNGELSDYTVNVSHTIDFDDPTTFNGNCEPVGACSGDNTQVKDNSEAVQFLKKGSNVPKYGGYDDQPSLGKFLYERGRAILKNAPPPGTTLEDFLKLPNTEFIIPTTRQEVYDSTYLTAEQKNKFIFLEDNQRIVAVEIGLNDPYKDNEGNPLNPATITNPDGTTTPNKNPGFDLQDNIFIVTSDIFKKKFDANDQEIQSQ